MDERKVDEHKHEIKWGAEPLPIENAMERRAICLRYALEGKAWLSFKDTTPEEQAGIVIATAKRFEQYIIGVS